VKKICLMGGGLPMAPKERQDPRMRHLEQKPPVEGQFAGVLKSVPGEYYIERT